MKILLVTPEYPPNNIGGGGIVVESLFNEIRDKNQKVRVVSGDHTRSELIGTVHSTDSKNSSIDFLPYVPPSLKPLLSSYKPPCLRYFPYIYNIFTNFDPDIIHFHGYGHVFVDFGAIISHILDIPYIVTVHGIPQTPKENGGLLKLGFDIYENTFGRIVLKNASAVTGVSNHILKKLNDKNIPINEKRIFNGINKFYHSDVSENQFRKSYNIEPSDNLIICVGAIEERKGFDRVISALPHVLEEFPNTRLVIVGKGGCKRKLENLSRKNNLVDNIIFTGYLDETTKKEAIIDADIMVVPSRREPFGLVALEAIKLGTPVIANRTGGLKEIISHNKGGTLVNAGNNLELASEIKNLLDTKTIPVDLSERFTWANIAEKYLNLYQVTIHENYKQ